MTQTSREWRRVPNILITGTPGTGKTSLSQMLKSELSNNSLQYDVMNVSEIAKEQNFIEQMKDAERDTFILEEDQLLDWMEIQLAVDNNKGFIVEYHSSEMFPERWFDLVICLRTDTNQLYQRLQKRGYNEAKISENVQCEIFGICEEEAKQSYEEGIIKSYQSNTIDDLEDISEQVTKMIIAAVSSK
jgi:adenylate kinase